MEMFKHQEVEFSMLHIHGGGDELLFQEPFLSNLALLTRLVAIAATK